MIKENIPLSLTESLKYIDRKKESGAQVKSFIEKFTNFDVKKAQELREKLESMGMIKIQATHIAKIIDFVPEDKESLNKIFVDVSLTENESKQILDAVKEFN